MTKVVVKEGMDNHNNRVEGTASRHKAVVVVVVMVVSLKEVVMDRAPAKAMDNHHKIMVQVVAEEGIKTVVVV